ncbi:MAG: hydrogenase [Sphingomonas bacterium]|nr:hydrogenase [Sphingomonas bacterium]MDB5718436.1 hydrogenase [Sphingomonas bacterium]
MSAGTSRYSAVAIFLHWTIALAIIAMVPLGWWMTDNLSNPAEASRVFRAYQLHKSIGLTILALSVLRLLWRLTHRFPPLPDHMPGWEKAAARISHILLYAVMLVMPITGWIYVSAGWNSAMNMPFAIPTLWFGLFEWPHLPGLVEASNATRSAAASASMSVHESLAWGAVALVVLHSAAALKHHFFDRDSVLAGMLPLVRAPRGANPAADRASEQG